MSSAKWRLSRLGLNELSKLLWYIHVMKVHLPEFYISEDLTGDNEILFIFVYRIQMWLRIANFD